jgi:hypothetical protein
VAAQGAGFGDYELFPDLSAKAAAVEKDIAVVGQSEAYHLITDLATSRIGVAEAPDLIREHLFTSQ